MFFGLGLENSVGIGFRFGRGIENRADLRCIFSREMGNRVGIGRRFIQGIDFWVGMGFIRPLAWPSVGRMQYAPTLTDENSSELRFVFSRGRGKWTEIAWIDIPGRAFGVVRL